MPRASPGSIISLVNPIFQQKALSSRAAQRARMAQPVTPDRTGVRSGATGSDACRGAAEACPGECRLWQVQSSAVQAAIDQQRALAAALDSPEASPQQDAGHAPAPRSNSAQEHADPGSRPNQSGHAAAGTARSTTPSAIKAVPKSKAKRGADKRESAKQGAVRNWWEPPPAEEGRAERAGGGGALHTRCTAAHSAHECAAGRPQAADRAQDQTSSPLSSEVLLLLVKCAPCWSHCGCGCSALRVTVHLLCSPAGLRCGNNLTCDSVVPHSVPRRGKESS